MIEHHEERPVAAHDTVVRLSFALPMAYQKPELYRELLAKRCAVCSQQRGRIDTTCEKCEPEVRRAQ